MKRGCPNQWQVEAARDGRLSVEDASHFERHRARCISCRAEASKVETVAALVRRAGPSQLDDLSLRRLRQRVLASADASLKSAPRRFGSLGIIVAIALPVALVALLARRPQAQSADSATPEATAALTQLGGLAVHNEAGYREGAKGADHQPHASPELSSSSQPEPSPRQDHLASVKSAPHRSAKAANAPPAAASPSVSANVAVDGYAEDLAYLRILALLEEGRKAEAVVAAHVYLARFPEGFRHVEVRSITVGQ